MKEMCIYALIDENYRFRFCGINDSRRPRPKIGKDVRIIFPPNTSPRRRRELYEEAMIPFRAAIDEIDDI